MHKPKLSLVWVEHKKRRSLQRKCLQNNLYHFKGHRDDIGVKFFDCVYRHKK